MVDSLLDSLRTCRKAICIRYKSCLKLSTTWCNCTLFVFNIAEGSPDQGSLFFITVHAKESPINLHKIRSSRKELSADIHLLFSNHAQHDVVLNFAAIGGLPKVSYASTHPLKVVIRHYILPSIILAVSLSHDLDWDVIKSVDIESLMRPQIMTREMGGILALSL